MGSALCGEPIFDLSRYCTHALLQEGKDGEWEVKEEYRGKLRYLDEIGDKVWQNHSEVVPAVLANEPGKLN